MAGRPFIFPNNFNPGNFFRLDESFPKYSYVNRAMTATEFLEFIQKQSAAFQQAALVYRDGPHFFADKATGNIGNFRH
jgi:hypothetical protein